MDAATVKGMLEQHFDYAGSDPVRGHEMYHQDAVLEFPQSGERFVGVDNLREWRSNYPADKIARESIYVAQGWDPPEWRAQWRAAP